MYLGLDPTFFVYLIVLFLLALWLTWVCIVCHLDEFCKVTLGFNIWAMPYSVMVVFPFQRSGIFLPFLLVSVGLRNLSKSLVATAVTSLNP